MYKELWVLKGYTLLIQTYLLKRTLFILFFFYTSMLKKGLKKQKEFLRNKVDKLQLEKHKLVLVLAKNKAKNSALRFKKDINKALLTALVAAFGFLIALSWKEVITEYVAQLTSFSPIQGRLIEAVIVTIIAVSGILIVTYFLSEK